MMTSFDLLFCIAIYLSSLDKVGIAISQAFGEHNYARCCKVYTQGLVSILILYGLVTLPAFLMAGRLLTLMGIEETNANIV